jgi:hypothetical protein
MTYNELVTAIQDYCENTFPTVDMNTFIKQAEQRIYNTVQLANLRKNMTGAVSANNKYLSTPVDFLSAYSLAVIDADGDYHYLLNKDANFIREAYPRASSTGLPQHYAIFGPTTTSDAVPVTTNELSLLLGPTPDAAYAVELHFYYYPESIIQAPVTTFGAITGGSAYTNGTYRNTALTGGKGSIATADIVVSGGAVTSVTVTQGGTGYVIGDVLSATAASIGGTGSGFSIPVATIGNASGQTWLGDNFDSALLNATMVEAVRYMKGEADMVKLYQDMYQQSIALLKNLGDGKQRTDAYRDGQVRLEVS